MAWAIPAITVAGATPALAASGSVVTGITGYQAPSYDSASTCPSEASANVTPKAGSTNPAPIVYVQTSVNGATGTSASMTISLYDVLPSGDATATTAAQSLGFIPGTYTVTNTSGVPVTATSTCLSTNAAGACTSITLTWALAAVFSGSSQAASSQNVPFRVGFASGATFTSSDQISTGFTAAVIGGGPAPVSAAPVATFNGGSYAGSVSCP